MFCGSCRALHSEKNSVHTLLDEEFLLWVRSCSYEPCSGLVGVMTLEAAKQKLEVGSSCIGAVVRSFWLRWALINFNRCSARLWLPIRMQNGYVNAAHFIPLFCAKCIDVLLRNSRRYLQLFLDTSHISPSVLFRNMSVLTSLKISFRHFLSVVPNQL